MIASFSMSYVKAFRRPRVAILSTGDELVEVGQPVFPGKVVDSNGISLGAMVKGCSATVQMLGIARDTVASHIEKMTAGLQADIFITSAGVSAGAHRFWAFHWSFTPLMCDLEVRPPSE